MSGLDLTNWRVLAYRKNKAEEWNLYSETSTDIELAD
jgi:hypothetical protein